MNIVGVILFMERQELVGVCPEPHQLEAFDQKFDRLGLTFGGHFR